MVETVSQSFKCFTSAANAILRHWSAALLVPPEYMQKTIRQAVYADHKMDQAWFDSIPYPYALQAISRI